MNSKLIIIILLLWSCTNNAQDHEVKITKSKITDSTSLESDMKYFENNPNYFIRDIDIDKDGVIDRIVSSKKYQGDELYLFVNENDQYNLILKTVNLSEDGGNIIDDIFATNNGDEVFKIHTYFPDGGNLQATHIISYNHKQWYLKRTVYEISNWRNNDTYMCDVVQDIPFDQLNNFNGFKEFKQISNELDRDKLCTKKQNLIFAKIDSVSLSQIIKTESIYHSIFDYYKKETIDEVEIWSDKMFGRCCTEADISYSELLNFR